MKHLLEADIDSMSESELRVWASDIRGAATIAHENAALWNKYKDLFEKMHAVTEAMAPVLHFRILIEDAKSKASYGN